MYGYPGFPFFIYCLYTACPPLCYFFVIFTYYCTQCSLCHFYGDFFLFECLLYRICSFRSYTFNGLAIHIPSSSAMSMYLCVLFQIRNWILKIYEWRQFDPEGSSKTKRVSKELARLFESPTTFIDCVDITEI